MQGQQPRASHELSQICFHAVVRLGVDALTTRCTGEITAGFCSEQVGRADTQCKHARPAQEVAVLPEAAHLRAVRGREERLPREAVLWSGCYGNVDIDDGIACLPPLHSGNRALDNGQLVQISFGGLQRGYGEGITWPVLETSSHQRFRDRRLGPDACGAEDGVTLRLNVQHDVRLVRRFINGSRNVDACMWVPERNELGVE